tara:strand:- start:32 stop:958 length:927 start_codon:yes stop_codon:yes gene_type:complete
MRKKTNFFLTLLLFFFLITNLFAQENKIVLKIDNEIITTLDVFNEIKILKLLNQNLEKLSKDEIIQIASSSIKKQKIKEIELKKYYKEIFIPDDELNPYLKNYFNKLGFENIENFNKYAKKNKININLIKEKISIELLWNQLVYKKFYKNVKINKETIKKEIIKKTKQNEYLLSEIIFSIENKKEFEEKLKKIKNDINSSSFENSALRNSISESSKDSGNIGWVKETSLSDKIKMILNKMEIDGISDPIKIPNGFLILKINDIRQVDIKLNIDEELDFAIRSKTNKQLKQFSDIYLNKISKDLIIHEL